MSTVNNRSEMVEVAKSEQFIELLLIDSVAEYEEKSRAFKKEHFPYYSNPYDEVISGVHLMGTPRVNKLGFGDWGTWINVSRVFDNPEFPYRVTAMEYSPTGQDGYDSHHVADFATLGQAVDKAFLIHEEGDIELDIIGVNVKTGEYQRFRGGVTLPEQEDRPASTQALEIDSLLKSLPRLRALHVEARALEQRIIHEVHDQTWSCALSHEQAASALTELPERMAKVDLDDYFEAMHAGATSINNRIFAGKGKLISCVSQALDSMGLTQCGTVFVALERESGEFCFVSPHGGIYETADEAKQYVVDMLKAQYANERIEENTYWIFDELWELDLDDVEFKAIEAMKIPKPDDLDPYPPVSYLVDQAVFSSTIKVRRAIEEQVDARVRKQHALKAQEPSFSL